MRKDGVGTGKKFLVSNELLPWSSGNLHGPSHGSYNGKSIEKGSCSCSSPILVLEEFLGIQLRRPKKAGGCVILFCFILKVLTTFTVGIKMQVSQCNDKPLDLK